MSIVSDIKKSHQNAALHCIAEVVTSEKGIVITSTKDTCSLDCIQLRSKSSESALIEVTHIANRFITFSILKTGRSVSVP